jgi:hypothetical protein
MNSEEKKRAIYAGPSIDHIIPPIEHFNLLEEPHEKQSLDYMGLPNIWILKTNRLYNSITKRMFSSGVDSHGVTGPKKEKRCISKSKAFRKAFRNDILDIPNEDKRRLSFLGFSKNWIVRDGRMWSDHIYQWIRPSQRKNDGRYIFQIKPDEGARKSCFRYRLLAQAFIPNDDPENKTQINHIDGDCTNDSITNLEWVSNKENMLHASRIGIHDNTRMTSEIATFICKQLSHGISPYQISISIRAIYEKKINDRVIYDIYKRRTYKDVSSKYIW